MKIFKSNQKYFARLGITQYQAMQHQPFNAKNLSGFIFMCFGVILFVGFLLNEANNSREYTESIYFTSAAIALTIGFFEFTWNMKHFFNLVDGWENCVEQS